MRFEELDQSEKDELLKFPAYISLLASNADGKLDEVEKKRASEITHIKTFSEYPQLKEFYKELEKYFSVLIDQLDQELPEGKEARAKEIKNELKKLENILLKLEKGYRDKMHQSMRSYISQVSKAHDTIFESVLFPISIKGLTE
jgi:hemerythrin superfamily protein